MRCLRDFKTVEMKTIKLLIASLILLYSSHAFALSEAKITIKVLSEEGLPIEGARVGITFHSVNSKGEVMGFTDASGFFTTTSEAIPLVGGNAHKEGYYQSNFRYTFQDMRSGKLLPWNPEVTLVLRKFEHPVAMYARQAIIEMPEIGKAIGFDLIAYDWVKPYGAGKESDFIFQVDKQFKSRQDFSGTLKVRFSNKYDGILKVKEDRRYGSLFKLPRFAPDKGYQLELNHYEKRSPGGPFENDYADAPLDDDSYIFRIRSEERDGKLLRSIYGKIVGEIHFDPMTSKTATIIFKYYLNSQVSQRYSNRFNWLSASMSSFA